MPVKIRLQRHGKKGKPFYWIVAADARSKRDGKYLEKLGAYNPNTNPATIELNVDGAVTWLQNGAQPTDTARAILSYKGALLKNHLVVGVRKGALTEEEADKKFNAWLDEKANKVDAKKDTLAKAKAEAKAKALEAEKAVNEARTAVVIEEVAEETVAEETIAEEVVAEEVAAEEVAEETTVDEIVTEEPDVEEVAEAPVAEETAEDAPVADAEDSKEEE
jgi:small subunit ribosomal protein S16